MAYFKNHFIASIKFKSLLISAIFILISSLGNSVFAEAPRINPPVTDLSGVVRTGAATLTFEHIQCEAIQKYEAVCSWKRPRSCYDILVDYETNLEHQNTWNRYQDLCNPIESTNPLDHLRQGEDRNTHECLRMLGIVDTCRSNYVDMVAAPRTATAATVQPQLTAYPNTQTVTARACFATSVVEAVDRFRGACGYQVSPSNYRNSASARCRALSETDPILTNYPSVCRDLNVCDCVNTKGCGAEFCERRLELSPSATIRPDVVEYTHPIPYGDDVHSVELPAGPTPDTPASPPVNPGTPAVQPTSPAGRTVENSNSISPSTLSDSQKSLGPDDNNPALFSSSNSKSGGGGCSMTVLGQENFKRSPFFILFLALGFLLFFRSRRI